jgi:hypothetical protein
VPVCEVGAECFASGFEPFQSGRLQESLLKRSYLDTKFSIGKDVIV